MKQFFYFTSEEYEHLKILLKTLENDFGHIALKSSINECTTIAELVKKLKEAFDLTIAIDSEIHIALMKEKPIHLNNLRIMTILTSLFIIQIKENVESLTDMPFFNRVFAYLIFLQAVLYFNEAMCLHLEQTDEKYKSILISNSTSALELIQEKYYDIEDSMFLSLRGKLLFCYLQEFLKDFKWEIETKKQELQEQECRKQLFDYMVKAFDAFTITDTTENKDDLLQPVDALPYVGFLNNYLPQTDASLQINLRKQQTVCMRKKNL